MNDFEKENKAPAFRASVETQQLAKRFAEIPEGETITWEEMEELTKCADRERLRGYIYTAFNTVQRESGIAFGSRPGIGYQRLTDDGKVDAGTAFQRQASRKAKRGMQVIACADEQNLSPAKRIEYIKTQTVLGVMRGAASMQTGKRLEQRIIDHKPVEAGDIMRLFG